MRRLLAALVLLPPLLAGCDLLGIEGASVVAARREAEGKAIGGACRHAARSIEQCYSANKKADKAAVFAGWREMNDYMRENKIEAMPALEPLSAAAVEEEGEAPAPAGAAPAKKSAAKADAPKAGAAPATASKAARPPG
jgi:hypothetical protein